MRFLTGTLILAAAASGASAQVPGMCVSGCNIPNPQQPQQPTGSQLDPRLIAIGVAAEIRGEVTYIYPNGERVVAGPQTPIVYGSKVITGAGAKVMFLFYDETSFTVGPSGEIVIDRFVYDPMHAEVKASIVKGAIRWVTGKVVGPPAKNISIRVPVGDLGIRGTDLEIDVDPFGSGTIILHEGQVDFEEYDTGRRFTIRPGQRLVFENFAVIGVK